MQQHKEKGGVKPLGPRRKTSDGHRKGTETVGAKEGVLLPAAQERIHSTWHRMPEADVATRDSLLTNKIPPFRSQ